MFVKDEWVAIVYEDVDIIPTEDKEVSFFGTIVDVSDKYVHVTPWNEETALDGEYLFYVTTGEAVNLEDNEAWNGRIEPIISEGARFTHNPIADDSPL